MLRPIFTIVLVFLVSFSSLGQLDSLRALIESQQGSDKGKTWVNISREYLISGQDSMALVEGRNALTYAEQQQDSATMAQAMYYLYLAHPQRDSALSWLERSEIHSSALHSPFQQTIREDLVIEYQDRAIFKEALRFAQKNLAFSKILGDTASIVNSAFDIGFTYDRMKSYNEAIAVYEEYLPMSKAFTKEPVLYGRCLGLIGIAYDELRDFEKAKEFNNKAISVFRRVGTARAERLLATWLSNLGNTLTKTKEFDAAETCLLESVRLNDKHNKKVGKAISNINLGKLLMDQGKLNDSYSYLSTGMRYSKENDLVRFQSEGHNRLSEYYTRTGQVDSALFHLERYHILNDSIINADKLQQIADLQVFYETAEKDRENQLLKQRNDILSLEKERQQFWLLSSFGLLALVSLISILAYRIYRATESARSQAKVIAEREQGIKVMIQSVEEERQRIAKDLHDGVGQQMTALKLKWNKLKKSISGSTTSEDLEDISSLIDNTSKDVRVVSHQMMPRALMELGLVPALRDMIEQSLDAANIPFTFEVLGNERRIAQDIEIGLFRVCQELVNNIIKHAKAEHVDIQIFFRERSLILTIEDDGVGIKNESKEGIGMLNIFSRVSALRGEAHYEDASDTGTVAVIRVPINHEES